MQDNFLKVVELSTEGLVLKRFMAPLAAYLYGHGAHSVRCVNGATLSMRRTISPFWDLVVLVRCWWLFRRWKPDVLHVHTAKAGAIGRLVAWLAGVPRVIYTAHDFPFHGDLSPFRQRLYAWIERHLATLCQAITVDSAAVRNRAVFRNVVPMRKLHIIPVGVDTARFDPDLYHVLAKHSDVIVGMVGRLVPEKGLDLLIDAIARIETSSLIPCRVMIVGAGSQQEELKRFARHVNIQAWFVGEVEDVRNYLAQMDVFALPTHREGLSVAVMEAMSMAKPVLVSALPAFQELVIDNETGILVHSDEWVAKLTMVLKSSALRQRLGLAARAHVQKYYEQSASNRAYERLLVGPR